MELTNFVIEDSFSAIEVDGLHRDLHNNYSFERIVFDSSRRELTVEWVKGQSSWVPEDTPQSLKLIFSDVSLFKCKERDSDMPYSEDDCMSSLGFIHNEMLDELEGFSYEKPSSNANHLNVSFMSGFAFKVAAKTATCLTC